MAKLDWSSPAGRDWVDLNQIFQDLKKQICRADQLRAVAKDARFLKELLAKAKAEADALMDRIENPPTCECKCSIDSHGSNGCKTWYGDRNTGFGCDCSWTGWPKDLKSGDKNGGYNDEY